MNTTRHIACILVVGLLSVSTAGAHDFWLERTGDAFLLRHGHAGGTLLAIDAGKLKSLRCLGSDGKTKDALSAARIDRTQVVAKAACAAISAYQDNGFFSLTPDGEKNLPKNQVKDAVKSWRSRQFAKWVDGRSPLQHQPLGDEFEVVPVTDLAKAKAGDKATFRMLLAGKPVAGAILSIDHKGIGESDDQGEVRVRVREGATMTVSASVRRPLRSAEADSETFEASLSFEVAK